MFYFVNPIVFDPIVFDPLQLSVLYNSQGDCLLPRVCFCRRYEVCFKNEFSLS